jgi:uncharacterized membrane protein YphA (DoxX/SURF4 family)
MFPLGAPGAALVIMRFAVAATLLIDGTAHWTLVTSLWLLIPIILTAACLCLGLVTPLCASLCCLMELYAVAVEEGQGIFHLVVSISISTALAILGPGAYSVDARIFGRKLLTVPSRHQPHSE